MGRTRQRRVRQPRVIVPLSQVPQIPNNTPFQITQLDSIANLKLIDEDEDSMSQSLKSEKKESISTPSLNESPAKISLPPTPITNPEKFGIKISKKKEEKCDDNYSSIISSKDRSSSLSEIASAEINDTSKEIYKIIYIFSLANTYLNFL